MLFFNTDARKSTPEQQQISTARQDTLIRTVTYNTKNVNKTKQKENQKPNNK